MSSELATRPGDGDNTAAPREGGGLRAGLASVLRTPLTRFDEVYPEREELHSDQLLDRMGQAVMGRVSRALRSRPGRVRAITGLVAPFEAALRALDDEGLRETARELRRQLRREGLKDELVGHAFALVRETADRVKGMRHFDTQLIG
ncbi:MAG: hypothetical protein EOO54_15610, partial [Haliea sp.]